MRKKWKKTVFCMGVLLLTAAIGIIGFFLAKNQPKVLKDGETMSVAAGQERIKSGADLIARYEYTFCAHKEEITGVIPSILEGKTRRETEEYYSDFRLELFTRDKICIEKKIETYCNKHLILKEEKGKLVVLRNIPGTSGYETVQELNLSPDGLQEKEREAVRLGRVFSKEEEIEKYLEVNHN